MARQEHPVYDRVLRVSSTATIYPTRTLVTIGLHRGLSRRGPCLWTDGWSLDLGSETLSGRPTKQILWHLFDAQAARFRPPEGQDVWT